MSMSVFDLCFLTVPLSFLLADSLLMRDEKVRGGEGTELIPSNDDVQSLYRAGAAGSFLHGADCDPKLK